MIALRAITVRSSLGPAPQVFAGLRARLTRPLPLGLMTTDPDGEASPLTGHPLRTLVGFSGPGRRVALAQPALADAVADPALAAARVALIVVSPGTPGVASALAQGAGLRWAAVQEVPRLVDALQAAEALLGSRAADHVVLVVVDSRVDPPSVEALEEAGRLKSASDPAGLSPGEAAVVLVLGASARGQAGRGQAGPGPAGGASVVHAVSVADPGALAGAGPAVDWLISPLNGEEPPARAFAGLQVRMRPGAVWHPAVSLGDTGAAQGAIGLGWAAAAWSRGYAPGAAALVVTHDQVGWGGIWVRAPEA